MKIRKEVISHLIAVWLTGAVIATSVTFSGISSKLMLVVMIPVLTVLTAYLIWFFRDPDRDVQEDERLILSAADGKVTSINCFSAAEFRKICLDSGLKMTTVDKLEEFSNVPVVRISVFLSLMDVHVNRAPIGGESEFLGYYPGKHLLTIKEKSSAVNQHNAIHIVNKYTGCLVFQIVGPIARRVVYWPDTTRSVPVKQGERIGMMKFGSRLDLYLPEPQVRMLVKPGEWVTAGVTPVAELMTVRLA